MEAHAACFQPGICGERLVAYQVHFITGSCLRQG
jgi:hypothetical protein